MRIFKWVAASLAVLVSGAALADDAIDPLARDALELGVTALHDGDYDLAMPALEFAAGHDFLAQYHLASVYSDPASGRTNHERAFRLYQRIADEQIDADPDDDLRAPFVGKSLTALARYLETGLPEIGLEPDPAQAAQYLRYSALFFRDEDAQFALAKLQLRSDVDGDGESANAKHWLSVLSQEGHPGAQAFLAELYWRGDRMLRNPVRALALATLSIENAPAAERLWIEEVHQMIYCGSSAAIRVQAASLAAGWRERYGLKRGAGEEGARQASLPAPADACAGVAPADTVRSASTLGQPDGATPGPSVFARGSAAGPGMESDGVHEAGVTGSTTPARVD